MRKIILSIFFMVSTLMLSSQVFSYASADFDDDPYDSQERFETTSNRYYSEDRYMPGQFVENSYQQVTTQTYTRTKRKKIAHKKTYSSGSYASRLPQATDYGEKVILINPRKHAWGAYSSDGKLLRAGIATAGASWCPDIHRACRTRSGSFRIYTLGSRSCYSKRYPVGRGGAPMPYCMFFNGNQGLHGSNQLAEANLSHGCVRIGVDDAAWVRFNFATIGTKVIVMSY